MDLDPEIVKWSGRVVGTIIAGTIMVYIGLQIRGSRDATKDHLKRTTALEIAQVRHSSHITTKLDDLINSHHRAADVMSSLSKSVGEVTASVARIEGVIEGATMRAAK